MQPYKYVVGVSNNLAKSKKKNIKVFLVVLLSFLASRSRFHCPHSVSQSGGPFTFLLDSLRLVN